MPPMRITFIVKDTISPTTHAEILASFCSSLHKKLCFVSIEEKWKKKYLSQIVLIILEWMIY